MRIAIIGCGFVADLYMSTLPLHPNLELLGVYDRDAERMRKFASIHNVATYPELDAILNDPRVETVLNLTNPRSHYAISRRCLEAGKHVYSEKPLAMEYEDAADLVQLAREMKLHLSSAPCNVLSDTAQTVWKALRDDILGTVRVIYAELEDGMVHQMNYKQWKTPHGTPWPFKDEFEVGCTLEHAGYYLTWLAAFFGPATSITAYSSVQVEDKGTPLDVESPDFSVACVRFASGPTARITCGIIAPHDHTLRIIGDKGVLSIKDCWHYRSPVYFQKLMTLRRKTFLSPWKRRRRMIKAPYAMPPKFGAAQMDFFRGVAEMADAIQRERPSSLASDFSLHVNEMALAIQKAGTNGGKYTMRSTFADCTPAAWAH